MKDFITGLQFLTRIRFFREDTWTAERFGRSVVFFPLVGAVIGLVLVAVYLIVEQYLPLAGISFSRHILATLLVAAHIIVTGGLHCDGFMDTIDGIFSGRPRERMLEIMKDSRVGANGVTAFILFVLMKWSFLMDISLEFLPGAIFLMPVLGRLCMVVGITCFDYARADGMGKAFNQYAGKQSLYIALFYSLIIVVLFGKQALFAGFAAVCCGLLFAGYISRILHGLTGDAYGAITEVTELLVLFFYVLLF
ncbi:putative membrane protein [Propionispora sp. 2/2-37]|uniref:adenosylcobinamide-GDP ribazoletransferase n=1 Tax=Propionispora sp. 2/2-37 TaxID=1677858 RepID=UPI0006BB84CF|nr:adenosylcobinamide-GDP ribazoletransferase [Propionispora sp. 2/2-37]CUH94017.1 putative membrane protein [Propionispora sp. 2/2-37]